MDVDLVDVQPSNGKVQDDGEVKSPVFMATRSFLTCERIQDTFS